MERLLVDRLNLNLLALSLFCLLYKSHSPYRLILAVLNHCNNAHLFISLFGGKKEISEVSLKKNIYFKILIS